MQKTEENNKTTILINKDGRKRELSKEGQDGEEIPEPQTIFKTTKYDKELLETDPTIFDIAKEDIIYDHKLEEKFKTEEDNSHSCPADQFKPQTLKPESIIF